MSIDSVLATDVVLQAEMQVNLVELVAIAEGPTGYIDRMAGIVFDREYHTVTGVCQDSTDFVLVEV